MEIQNADPDVEQDTEPHVFKQRVPALLEKAPLVIILVAVAVGSWIRLVPVFSVEFPLLDGGLFYLMVQELRQAEYALPEYTSYNSGQIPFVYPPFGFYAAALIADITNSPLINVQRIFPAVVSALTIPVFFILSRVMLASLTQAAFATLAFALLPRSFEWFILGGGLTRAPGLLFALLTLSQGYLLYRSNESRFAASTIVGGSLTVLSHAEKTWFLIYSMALLFVFFGRSRKGILHSLVVIVGILLVTMPWWGLNISRHGLMPFLSAAQSGGGQWFSLWPLKSFVFTGEPMLPLFAVLGLFGMFVCLAKGTLFLPVWLVAVFFLQPRAAPTWASIPLALLAAITLDQMVLPALRAQMPIWTGRDISTRRRFHHVSVLSAIVPILFVGYLASYEFLSDWRLVSNDPLYRPLPRSEREAMGWIAENTAGDSAFVVLSSLAFPRDSTSEWFPVLAKRLSLATVQGTEWLPGRQFYKRWQQFEALQRCANDSETCLQQWEQEADRTFTHVYLVTGCCRELIDSLSASRHYLLIFQGKGGTVFARIQQPAIQR
ncbi:MAG TPA: hypothetical protein VJV04_03305 [Nitrospiraceae bacterium]|nr:hypothetical protein [Nitrospiraceae bacterium]